MSAPIILALRLTMAFALYGFLGWAIFVLWRDVQKQGALLANRRVPGISLAIRFHDETPVVKNFSQAEIVIGRDPGCDIALADDTVSTRHAQLTYHHGQWWLSDLTSTNGTALNNILLSMPTVLASGDEIHCGGTRLSVNLSTDAFISPTLKLERKP
ncbi:MAG: FHA domain-containing protein [Chloroflexi bacterium]|nr:FHA domain-containing protein [Chloroflexota bacterium]